MRGFQISINSFQDKSCEVPNEFAATEANPCFDMKACKHLQDKNCLCIGVQKVTLVSSLHVYPMISAGQRPSS